MGSYQDIHRALALIDWDELGKAYPIARDEALAILQAAGTIIDNEIAPLARQNDTARYTLTPQGDVVWPEGIERQYAALRDNGFVSVGVKEEFGGNGLPGTITVALSEMLARADAGFSTIPLLQSGAAQFIQEKGSDALKCTYLPLLASGACVASMDLTEPGAGSDLGQITTRAIADGERARITGEKVFITSGGAQLHLVLARDAASYDQTRGTTKGLSVYLVPREIDGKRNGVRVTRLEEKLGIHSSPTCSVLYEDAIGLIVGEPGQGLKYMFALMNHARLGVAAQSLGVLEAARHAAERYASERSQFGAPIGRLALVQEKIADLRVSAALNRALLYTACVAADLEHRDARAKERAALLTPLVKFYAAESAVRLARDALQVHGGNGYTMEYDAQRHLRDAIIMPIYEGTSQIQASLFTAQAVQGHIRRSLHQPARVSVERLLSDLAGHEPVPAEVRHAIGLVRSSLRRISWEYLRSGFSGRPLREYPAVMRDIEGTCDREAMLCHAERFATMSAETIGALLLSRQARADASFAPLAALALQDLVARVEKAARTITPDRRLAVAAAAALD